MQINILLTKEMRPSIPEDIEIIFNVGTIHLVPTNDHNDLPSTWSGENVILKEPKESITKWFKEFDGIWINKSGVPQLEQFTWFTKDDLIKD